MPIIWRLLARYGLKILGGTLLSAGIYFAISTYNSTHRQVGMLQAENLSLRSELEISASTLQSEKARYQKLLSIVQARDTLLEKITDERVALRQEYEREKELNEILLEWSNGAVPQYVSDQLRDYVKPSSQDES